MENIKHLFFLQRIPCKALFQKLVCGKNGYWGGESEKMG